MKTLLSFVLSGVAIIALSGCGSSSSTDPVDPTEVTDPTTPEEIATSIVGTWKTACYADTININNVDVDVYVIETMVFEADDTGSYTQDIYDVAGCNATDKVDDFYLELDYKVGAVVTAADGEDAVEFDFLPVDPNEEGFYTMVRFDASKLLFADGDNTSPTNRGDDFTDPDVLTRQ